MAIFFPAFSPIPHALKVAALRFPRAGKDAAPGVYFDGSGLGRIRLSVASGGHLPDDLTKYTSCGGTIWTSPTEGDLANGGAYLRQYSNGVYAIHIGTWHLQQDFEKMLVDTTSPSRSALLAAARNELNRRIAAVQDAERSAFRPTHVRERAS